MIPQQKAKPFVGDEQDKLRARMKGGVRNVPSLLPVFVSRGFFVGTYRFQKLHVHRNEDTVCGIMAGID